VRWGHETAGGMSGLEPASRELRALSGSRPEPSLRAQWRIEILKVFCGIDWAEDHVRHEASEVERR
jgi:hypothetical protein